MTTKIPPRRPHSAQHNQTEQVLWSLRVRDYRGHIALLALATYTACGPVVELDFKADAETYIRAMCEDRVVKYEECEQPIPDTIEDSPVEECVDNQLNFDEPCFAEEDEFFRCRVERLDCEEYFNIHIDTSPGSTCFEFLLILSECRARHRSSGNRG